MIRSAFVAALCTVSAGSAIAQGALYGVAGYSNFGTQSLYAINPATGSATLIGNTGLRQIAGLDFDQSTGRLMALTVAGDAYALDLTTGASALVTDANFAVPEGDVAYSAGVAHTAIFDSLHTWSGSSWQQVGPSGLAGGADVSGLDFGAASGSLLGLALFGAGADQLVRFDTTTGVASIIGPTGTNAAAVADLAFDFVGGAWYLTDGASLFSVDPLTGAAASIGSLGATGFSGLAYVPSPGAGVLFAAGVVVAARRRRTSPGT